MTLTYEQIKRAAQKALKQCDGMRFADAEAKFPIIAQWCEHPTFKAATSELRTDGTPQDPYWNW